jgi:cellobiose-specific phosphotransferase system component IIC
VRVGVAVAIVACLYMTTRSYLYAIYDGSIPQAEGYLLSEYVAYGLAIVVFVIFALSSRSFDNRVSKIVRANTNEGLFTALKVGIYSSIIYTLFSAVAATMVATSPSSFWYPIDWKVRSIIIGTATWVSVASLIPLVFLLGSAVPPFGQRTLPDRHSKDTLADAPGSQDPELTDSGITSST